MRRKLALGLQQTAEVVQRAVELMTGEVAPDTGLLAAASGETAERIGLDSGLYPQLMPLYAAATDAGADIQVGGGGVAGRAGEGAVQAQAWAQGRGCQGATRHYMCCTKQRLENSLPGLPARPPAWGMHAGVAPSAGVCPPPARRVPPAAQVPHPCILPAHGSGALNPHSGHDNRWAAQPNLAQVVWFKLLYAALPSPARLSAWLATAGRALPAGDSRMC